MSEPVFFPPKSVLSLANIVALTLVLCPREADLDRRFDRADRLDRAGPRSITVCHKDEAPVALARTRAGACFIAPDQAAYLPPTTIALLCEAPEEAFRRVLAVLYPDALRPSSLFATRGVSPAACIHPDARLEPDVVIDPGVVIGPKAEIGAGTIISANTVIGPDVRIGRDCAIGAQVTIACALIGNRVVIAPGVRIGQDGAVPAGLAPGLGRVIIQDDVNVGANTTLDRGGLRDTVLGEGSTIGNLVHVRRDSVIARFTVVSTAPPNSRL